MRPHELAWDPGGRHVAAAWRYLVAVVFVVHGLIHALGFAATWRLGQVHGIAHTPTVPAGLAADSPLAALLGVLWLAATLRFVAGAMGVIVTAGRWHLVAMCAALLSLLLCAAWWNDARAGAVTDVAILAGLAISAWSARSREA